MEEENAKRNERNERFERKVDAECSMLKNK